MRRIVFVVTIFLALGLADIGRAQAPNLESMDFVLKSVPDGPVAKVNGTNISAETFRGVYKSELRRLEALGGGRDIPSDVRLEIGLMSLGILIQRELLHGEALQNELEVSDEELLEGWKGQVEQLKEGFPQGDSLSEAELLNRLGITREMALNDLSRGILISRMRDRILGDETISVSDEELKEAFKESKSSLSRPDLIHLKQIFVSPKHGAGTDPKVQTAKAKEKAEAALDRIFAGQRFEKVAESMSESPDRKQGGDMGLVTVKSLPDFMASVAAALEPGGVSDVIESEYGFHIVKLVEFSPGVAPSLKKASPFLRRRIMELKGDDIVRDYCDSLIKGGNRVLIFLELDKTLGANPSLRHLLSKK